MEYDQDSYSENSFCGEIRRVNTPMEFQEDPVCFLGGEGGGAGGRAWGGGGLFTLMVKNTSDTLQVISRVRRR